MRPTAPFRAPSAGFFPDGARAAFSDGSDWPAALSPEEATFVAHAVESRRREFALGRACARRALAELGVAPQPIPVGIDRAPCWPPDIVGSITHCKGFVGAVVAYAHRLRAIGFDAERAEPLEPDIIPLVCTTREIAWVGGQRSAPLIDWPKVIFSGKEAVHKCISPLSGQMLDFLDVILEVDSAQFTFTVAPSATTSAIGRDLASITGRIEVTSDFVFTCAFVDPTRA